MKTFIFIAFALCFGIQMPSNAAEIWVNKNAAVSSISQALSIAEDGDSIFVEAGVYKEGKISITKSVSIIGKNNPVVDGENKNALFVIEADRVLIKGITFKNVGQSQLEDNAAIRLIKNKHCIIEENTILNSYYGIYLEGADSSVIRTNKISGEAERESTSGNAIHAWNTKNSLIENNELSGHRDGIYLEFVENSTIKENYSHNNLRYGLHFMFSNDNQYLNNQFSENGAGVAVMYSKRIEMTGNIFSENQGAAAYGILLKDISDSQIKKNIFLDNTIGLFAEGSIRLKIKNNDFKQNGWAVKMMGSCEDLSFIKNNFMGNSFEISTSSNKAHGHRFKNNYWSSYNGYDLNKDGIGDVPHRPVQLFSYLVEKVPTAIVLINTLFIDLLELAEKVTPSLTPVNLYDENPSMKTNKW